MIGNHYSHNNIHNPAGGMGKTFGMPIPESEAQGTKGTEATEVTSFPSIQVQCVMLSLAKKTPNISNQNIS